MHVGRGGHITPHRTPHRGDGGSGGYFSWWRDVWMAGRTDGGRERSWLRVWDVRRVCVSGRQSVLIWEAEWVRCILTSHQCGPFLCRSICVCARCMSVCMCVSQRFLSPQLMLMPMLVPGCQGVCGCARLLATWGVGGRLPIRGRPGQVSARSLPLRCHVCVQLLALKLVPGTCSGTALCFTHTHTHTQLTPTHILTFTQLT